MSEFQNKNDYSVIVFDCNGFLVKSSYVHDVYKYSLWLSGTKYANWTYINVYARRSQRFIQRYYKGNFIPQKPK